LLSGVQMVAPLVNLVGGVPDVYKWGIRMISKGGDASRSTNSKAKLVEVWGIS